MAASSPAASSSTPLRGNTQRRVSQRLLAAPYAAAVTAAACEALVTPRVQKSAVVVTPRNSAPLSSLSSLSTRSQQRYRQAQRRPPGKYAPLVLEAIDRARRQSRRRPYVHLTAIRARLRWRAAAGRLVLSPGWPRRLHRQLERMVHYGELHREVDNSLAYAFTDRVSRQITQERRQSGLAAPALGSPKQTPSKNTTPKSTPAKRTPVKRTPWKRVFGVADREGLPNDENHDSDDESFSVYWHVASRLAVNHRRDGPDSVRMTPRPASRCRTPATPTRHSTGSTSALRPTTAQTSKRRRSARLEDDTVESPSCMQSPSPNRTKRRCGVFVEIDTVPIPVPASERDLMLSAESEDEEFYDAEDNALMLAFDPVPSSTDIESNLDALDSAEVDGDSPAAAEEVASTASQIVAAAATTASLDTPAPSRSLASLLWASHPLTPPETPGLARFQFEPSAPSMPLSPTESTVHAAGPSTVSALSPPATPPRDLGKQDTANEEDEDEWISPTVDHDAIGFAYTSDDVSDDEQHPLQHTSEDDDYDHSVRYDKHDHGHSLFLAGADDTMSTGAAVDKTQSGALSRMAIVRRLVEQVVFATQKGKANAPFLDRICQELLQETTSQTSANTVEALRLQIVALEKQLKQCEVDYSTELATLRERYRVDTTCAERELAVVAEQLEHARGEIARLQTALEDADQCRWDELAAKELLLEELRGELEQARAHERQLAAEQHAAWTSEQLAKFEIEVAARDAHLNELQEERRSLQGELELLRGKLHVATSERDTIQRQLDEQRAAVDVERQQWGQEKDALTRQMAEAAEDAAKRDALALRGIHYFHTLCIYWLIEAVLSVTIVVVSPTLLTNMAFRALSLLRAARPALRPALLARPTGFLATRAALPRASLAAAVRSISSTVPRFGQGLVDRDLVHQLDQELKLELEDRDAEVPDFLRAFQAQNKFQLHDVAGRDEVTLTRAFGNEQIRRG
ncbi:hypothetical protein THASP1DRAFT_31972 [Thamnocephalis sphaerospora]|uniref:Uncharacterized protein n=1 Tax=Thamnocephalis sphaerospora TaxID=78915 RepID=A0A4P9XKC7_9FUNG|nr:hypothetical protein THASP1DRAFT_31972 [Thamnocephalis sphaerospora]|eukprot:RKP06206.1 hypothetical protein THASP1DRAFT_31972 [Thamnocephalis sphaerospora]